MTSCSLGPGRACLSQPISLRWQVSVPVSCFHAADALLRKRPLVNPELCTALAVPAERLQAALTEEWVPADVFWSHLIPLAAGIVSLRELAEVTLTKTLGHADAVPRVGVLHGLLTDLKNAFSTALPGVKEDLASRLAPLQQSWSYNGMSLLGRVVNWTEAGVLVEEAGVVLVYPALGGGGGAHLPYNLVHIEAVAADPVAELPEVARLCWLLSMLNLDIPRYSEQVRPNRLTAVASLAMIPVVLAAAAEVQLARCDEETVALAVRAWLRPAEQAEVWTTTLNQWWGTYGDMRPEWPTALKALDLLLD